MARRHQFHMSLAERQERHFSEEFKRRKVNELERKLITISELCREYEVSDTAIYKWINKYSRMKKKKERMVVESESDTRKIKEMKERIKELERIIGQKQLMIDFQEKMIELAEEEYKIDIKKKSGSGPCSGTGSTGKSTASK
jgi:transposase